MPSVGGLSQSCLFRKHPHWRWTAASVGDRIKCPDSAIRCGCRASCRIHAIFFIVFSCSELGTEKKRKATTLHSGRASGISARPGTAGRNFWGAPTAKIDGHQSGCSKKKIASIFIHFGLFFFGQKFPSGSMLLRPFIGPIEAAPCHYTKGHRCHLQTRPMQSQRKCSGRAPQVCFGGVAAADNAN